MSAHRLQLNEFDIEFLAALCAEEAMRCRAEQRTVRHRSQLDTSKKREDKSMELLAQFTKTLQTLDEDDGMESRPELN